MSINKAEQNLQSRLIKTVSKLEREMLGLKLTQPIGADVLEVISIPEGAPSFAGPYTIPSNAVALIGTQGIPASEELTLWDFAITFYVDGTTSEHVWPFGDLSPAFADVRISCWLDWHLSFDAENRRQFFTQFENLDSVAHDIYFKYKFYIPQTGASGSVG